MDSSAEPGGQSHSVGKPWPWPPREPRWCRLLPTAWLSGFPSGFTSSPLLPPPPTVPRETGRPLAELTLSPQVPQAPASPFPHTPQSQASPGGAGGDSTPPQGAPAPGPFRAGRPHPHSGAEAPLSAAITGLWVWAVVFAAGLGRSSSGKASRALTV